MIFLQTVQHLYTSNFKFFAWLMKMGVIEGAAAEQVREQNAKEEDEQGTMDFEEEKVMMTDHNHTNNDHNKEFQASKFQTLNPTNPLRIAINNATRVASLSPQQQPLSTPSIPQVCSLFLNSAVMVFECFVPFLMVIWKQQPVTLNSRRYTNKISLFIFLLHMLIAIAMVAFLVFKGVEGLIRPSSDSKRRKQTRLVKYFLPQVEAASVLSIVLALTWQTAIRKWPKFMIHFTLWCSFFMSLSAGILILCFQKPPTDGVGVSLVAFSIGNGLYACWVQNRIKFCSKILTLSLQPVSKFHDLNQPTFYMLGAALFWMSLWTLAVIGALNFCFPPLVIIALVLSLAWVSEVMRNVVNISVSRVVALYYLRGMQSSTRFGFLRALTRNLGSACLGSLFVPAIEAARVVARFLNLLEGEDEFLFCCARCCLRVMESIFRYGNGWAYVQIAAYGKGFVAASQDTWSHFKRLEMEPIVDSDITTSICFHSGVSIASICVIVVSAWTSQLYQNFIATLSLLTFFISYLLVSTMFY
ncbi:hypothetical protein PIB30_065127 [Stylosanthes scabra]|uniref:Choline transporter-like protein n=1 Tax=Stylosanthes scabra TaxID=79078 RepID=A0ABU6SM02_9FABA|nr:hypothetical protein [Stylosanthes scabra]